MEWTHPAKWVEMSARWVFYRFFMAVFRSETPALKQSRVELQPHETEGAQQIAENEQQAAAIEYLAPLDAEIERREAELAQVKAEFERVRATRSFIGFIRSILSEYPEASQTIALALVVVVIAILLMKSNLSLLPTAAIAVPVGSLVGFCFFELKANQTNRNINSDIPCLAPSVIFDN
jgi:hypothetical protein